MTAIAPVITIDGPSGAGKGTLCKAMAEALQRGYCKFGRLCESQFLARVL